MLTKQTESKAARKSSKFANAVVVILAIVIAVGAWEVGAKLLGSLTAPAESGADFARPDLWAMVEPRLHN